MTKGKLNRNIPVHTYLQISFSVTRQIKAYVIKNYLAFKSILWRKHCDRFDSLFHLLSTFINNVQPNQYSIEVSATTAPVKEVIS